MRLAKREIRVLRQNDRRGRREPNLRFRAGLIKREEMIDRERDRPLHANSIAFTFVLGFHILFLRIFKNFLSLSLSISKKKNTTREHASIIISNSKPARETHATRASFLSISEDFVASFLPREEEESLESLVVVGERIEHKHLIG